LQNNVLFSFCLQKSLPFLQVIMENIYQILTL
jgi:hypothetical protein